jgi:hypothetical protein
LQAFVQISVHESEFLNKKVELFHHS